jgi:hypothetical protein
MTQATKVKKLEKKVAELENMYGEIFRLIHGTLARYKCKSCSLYHFPDRMPDCPEKGKERGYMVQT